jgi:thiol-disulfide isomerase/thioredoxin
MLIGVNAWVKRHPTAEDLRKYAEAYEQPREWRGRVAPDFELTMLDGSVFRLQDAVGQKVVVLNFFATWCGPCRAEMPELQRWAQANAANNVVLVGIDAHEKASLVKDFTNELRLTFPIGIDDSGDILERYDVKSFPTTIVIGADGRVKLRESGAIMNANVSLDPVATPEIAALRERRGISKEAFLSAWRAQAADDQRSNREMQVAAPDPRAARIAGAMPCPCGCSDRVAKCGCQTAKGIKARLAEGGYGGKTDAEVMEELNKEFCMKGM